MKYRSAARLGVEISEIGLGAWAIGGDWGDVSDDDAVAAIEASLDAGVTFIDTADVYGDGRSEKLIAQTLAKRGGPRPFVATKAGRRLKPHVADGYTGANIEAFIDRSLTNLNVDTLDLVQLHCPPTDVYYRPELFDDLERMKAVGKIQRYGVSVERVEEALKAIRYPGVVSVQIIFNMFRQRPAEALFKAARELGVAIIARVPLGERALDGTDVRKLNLRRNRSPQLQPPWRGVRRRRNIRRRPVRSRPRSGRGAAGNCADGDRDGRLRVEMDTHA